MEKVVNIHMKKLPEGVYLAPSDDVPGLVAQGRTVTEALEIARDVARKLLEARAERSDSIDLSSVGDSFNFLMRKSESHPRTSCFSLERFLNSVPRKRRSLKRFLMA